jgi:hypothetical protein
VELRNRIVTDGGSSWLTPAHSSSNILIALSIHASPSCPPGTGLSTGLAHSRRGPLTGHDNARTPALEHRRYRTQEEQRPGSAPVPSQSALHPHRPAGPVRIRRIARPSLPLVSHEFMRRSPTSRCLSQPAVAAATGLVARQPEPAVAARWTYWLRGLPHGREKACPAGQGRSRYWRGATSAELSTQHEPKTCPRACCPCATTTSGPALD